ncbi:hypothetical protein A3K78_01290 [Candidatus Bathyarchaeota archaeon RBG_13_52_12]|nr:MAG: hypothetical protein A3K78_01290 [Candidatus Bathyarchaeota archaeon RBG_13_52_12]
MLGVQARARFVGEERYWEYWIMPNDPLFIKRMRKELGDDIHKQVINADGSKHWVMKAIGFTCKGCPAFIDEKIIRSLQDTLMTSNRKPNH